MPSTLYPAGAFSAPPSDNRNGCELDCACAVPLALDSTFLNRPPPWRVWMMRPRDRDRRRFGTREPLQPFSSKVATFRTSDRVSDNAARLERSTARQYTPNRSLDV